MAFLFFPRRFRPTFPVWASFSRFSPPFPLAFSSRGSPSPPTFLAKPFFLRTPSEVLFFPRFFFVFFAKASSRPASLHFFPPGPFYKISLHKVIFPRNKLFPPQTFPLRLFAFGFFFVSPSGDEFPPGVVFFHDPPSNRGHLFPHNSGLCFFVPPPLPFLPGGRDLSIPRLGDSDPLCVYVEGLPWNCRGGPVSPQVPLHLPSEDSPSIVSLDLVKVFLLDEDSFSLFRTSLLFLVLLRYTPKFNRTFRGSAPPPFSPKSLFSLSCKSLISKVISFPWVPQHPHLLSPTPLLTLLFKKSPERLLLTENPPTGPYTNISSLEELLSFFTLLPSFMEVVREENKLTFVAFHFLFLLLLPLPGEELLTSPPHRPPLDLVIPNLCCSFD